MEPENAASSRRPRRILVVDDDEDLREVIGWVLKDAGFEVTPSGDAAAALDLLRRGDISLVFLDLGLGEMSGTELMAQRLLEPVLPKTPVVLMSGEPDLQHAAQRLGAVAHLRKPFDLDALVEVARRFALPEDDVA